MKKVVIFGGGSGLSNILRSLKDKDIDLTVFVTVSDNGGSTGKIRNHYQIPAPGDLRRAVLALSNEDKIEKLMNYRFDEKLDNHTVGNLILTALMDIENDMEKAVARYSKILGVNKKIYPVTNQNVDIHAVLEDDTMICGETQMVASTKKIKKVFYPSKFKASPRVIASIKEADYIIFSAGSLFTSILSNIVFDNMIKELPKTKAKKIYISNIFTEAGETDNFTVSDHVKIINNNFETNIVDYVLVNNNFKINPKIKSNYVKEKAHMVKNDIDKISDCVVVENDYITISEGKYIRHNTELIAKDIMKIINGDDNEESNSN